MFKTKFLDVLPPFFFLFLQRQIKLKIKKRYKKNPYRFKTLQQKSKFVGAMTSAKRELFHAVLLRSSHTSATGMRPSFSLSLSWLLISADLYVLALLMSLSLYIYTRNIIIIIFGRFIRKFYFLLFHRFFFFPPRAYNTRAIAIRV